MLSEKLFQCDQMCLETGPRRQNPPPSFITVFISVYILRPHLWVTCVSVHFWIDKIPYESSERSVCVVHLRARFLLLLNGTTYTFSSENVPQYLLIYPPRNAFKWMVLICSACSAERSSIGGHLNGSQLPFNRRRLPASLPRPPWLLLACYAYWCLKTHALISPPSGKSAPFKTFNRLRACSQRLSGRPERAR